MQSLTSVVTLGCGWGGVPPLYRQLHTHDLAHVFSVQVTTETIPVCLHIIIIISVRVGGS